MEHLRHSHHNMGALRKSTKRQNKPND
jgi:hypothetical protein